MSVDPVCNRPLTIRNKPEIRVGHGGDIPGCDDKALQAGVEYLHRFGGGTLRILPGEYTMRNALYLRPDVTITGAGDDTILKKTASHVTSLKQDADWYEAQIIVEDPAGFKPGDGIMLRSYPDGPDGRMEVVKDTITAMDGHVVSLSRRLEKNMWLEHHATAASLFPLITAEWVNDVRIKNLVFDGNRSENDEINGNYAGAVFIQHCDYYTFSHVRAKHYNGDGFSFQVCDDIHFEHCVSENNANLGFHPGSGSQRPIFKGSASRGNSQGIFFCWGVSDGLVEDCRLTDNNDFGISIGHRDTDNRIVGTLIENNARTGILFRNEGEDTFLAGHRTTIESSIIRDNGAAEDGIGLDIRGQVHDTVVRLNTFEDSGQGRQRIGIRPGENLSRLTLFDNTFTGLKTKIAK